MKKFTLLELIIVIATIGILITLLLPTLQKSRERAMQSVCMSNQKQCGIAFVSYAKDYNSKIYVHDETAPATYQKYWAGQLLALEYFTGYTVFKCPTFAPFSNNVAETARSFGINKRCRTNNFNDSDAIQITADEDSDPSNDDDSIIHIDYRQIDVPSEFLIIADSVNAEGSTERTQSNHILSYNTTNSGPHLRHLNRANSLFADGHVQSSTRSNLINFGFQYGYLESLIAW
ncbi:MAG: hypothetical protein MK132_13840 [Lentisphaerales bacterium]|nr:hypothetical protein [Lentisphaerales bacterium]